MIYIQPHGSARLLHHCGGATTLKLFPHLPFPHFVVSEKTPEQPSFGGELVAGFRSSYAPIRRAKANDPSND